MHKGRLTRIILVILILGMGSFLLIRNYNLKKSLSEGKISQITAKDFLPFGSSVNQKITDVVNNILDTKNDTPQIEDKKTLSKISEKVAGLKTVLINDEVEGKTGTDDKGNSTYNKVAALRYVKSENGYVYDYVPKYKKSYLISDTEIPHVSIATFSPDGNTILFQYLDGDLKTEKSVIGTLGGSNINLLPDNIISFSFGQNNKFAYFKKTTYGANLILRDLITNKETIIYNSPISEWNTSFINEDSILITTKASEYADGFAYIVNTKNKIVSKLWSGISGLTTKVSMNGNYILRGETIASGPVLSLYNMKTKSLIKLSKMGLVEKCNFIMDETNITCAIPKSFENKAYPDSWYLGEVKTDDALIRYTTENLNERILKNLSSEADTPIDVLKLDTNVAGDFVSFINKNDSSLWIYEE